MHDVLPLRLRGGRSRWGGSERAALRRRRRDVSAQEARQASLAVQLRRQHPGPAQSSRSSALRRHACKQQGSIAGARRPAQHKRGRLGWVASGCRQLQVTKTSSSACESWNGRQRYPGIGDKGPHGRRQSSRGSGVPISAKLIRASRRRASVATLVVGSAAARLHGALGAMLHTTA